MKKNSIAKMFAKSLLKSIVGLAIILGVGFASYKISYSLLSNSSMNVGTSSENIKNIIEDAQIDEISKNLIYVYDGNKITHLMLEICNTKTHNMDYITIPAKTDYTIPTEMYQKLCTVNQEIPQIVCLNKLKTYFESEDDAYGYGELIIEDMLGTKISYYTAIDQNIYDSCYTEVYASVNTKKQKNGTATQKISVASDLYKNQLKALGGDEKNIAEYIKEQYNSVNSNLTVYNKIGYIESYERMNVDYFHYWGIPGKYNGDTFIVNTNASRNYIENFVNNDIPYVEVQKFEKTSSDTINTDNGGSKSSVGKKIILLNGSKVTGLAASTKEKLTNAGYKVGNIGDYSDSILARTKIIVKEEGYGNDLAGFFKNPEVTTGNVKAGYDIEIIIGKADAK